MINAVKRVTCASPGTKCKERDAAGSAQPRWIPDYAARAEQYDEVASGHVMPGVLPLGDFEAFVGMLRAAVARFDAS